MTAGLVRQTPRTRVVRETLRALNDPRMCALAFLLASMVAGALAAPGVAFVCLVLGVALRVMVRSCAHPHATYRRGIFGDEINERGGHRSEWVCDECDTVFTRPELVEPERDPVGLLFDEIEALALADVVAERDLLRKRLRGLANLLAQRGLHVRWNDPQPVEGENHEDRLVSMLTAAAAERDKWKERYEEVSELYDRAREMIGQACDGCVNVTTFDSKHTQFECTGRGYICRPLMSRVYGYTNERVVSVHTSEEFGRVVTRELVERERMTVTGPGQVVELRGQSVTPEEYAREHAGDILSNHVRDLPVRGD